MGHMVSGCLLMDFGNVLLLMITSQYAITNQCFLEIIKINFGSYLSKKHTLNYMDHMKISNQDSQGWL